MTARKRHITPRMEKKVTRYTYDSIKEPRTPETGHTPLLPADEQVVTLPMDNGWSKAVIFGKLPEGDERPVVVDMDPVADPVLFWAGKRNRREVPVLPHQRNEIVSESRIAQIVERARKAAEEKESGGRQLHLFADLEKEFRESDRKRRIKFYTHEEGWKNKLICGDSLHVMESLLHYEGLRGKVQMIYIDPPYGIKYDSNFQQRVDSTKNDEKDQADDVLTIKAFRDTWALGIHSYLTHLSERLYLARELLSDTGSIFVQINEASNHIVRSLLEEVFGAHNYMSFITFRKKMMPLGAQYLETVSDYLIWYAKDKTQIKFRRLYIPKLAQGDPAWNWVELADRTRRRLTKAEIADHSLLPSGSRVFQPISLLPAGFNPTGVFSFRMNGKTYSPPKGSSWGTSPEGMERLIAERRILAESAVPRYILYFDDYPVTVLTDNWSDAVPPTGKTYVVQTDEGVVSRCMLMTTDPGDLVFDPTCGSGTTARVAELWGRRWITCDTSRVAVNVARTNLLARVMPHFITRNGTPSSGLSYRKVPHVTMGSIANRLESDSIELRDVPDVDSFNIRVCGPFEILTLGRYSIEDWKGYVVHGADATCCEVAKLQNYIEVICRLYRKDSAIQGARGFVHAIAETEKEKIAISVGPLSGRVTAKQINDAVQDALASGILEIHVLGWAFEANVGEVKSTLESRGKVKVELIMIRPDTLSEGLKMTQPEMLFSPLALPDIEVKIEENGKDKKVVVTLKGVALFDRRRRTTDYKMADSGYISAWYLDEDYDGDCFVDCQMFFDFKKMPNIKAALKTEMNSEEFALKLTSEPFSASSYKRIAVKVVDVYGNESTVVRDLLP